MKAVVFAGDGAVRVDEVPEPVIEAPTDAIVRVRRAAICGTDLHTVSHGAELPTGFVLGHEYVGEVVEVGSGVFGHRVGDRVVGADYTACGQCWWCRHGDHWHCPQRRFFGTGSTFGPPLPGAQAELLRVPYADTVLRPLPDDVDLDAAVFLGDTLATGYAAIDRGGLRTGDTVVVVGGGPVGQLTSLVAQACGAGIVVLVEPVAERRELARAEGALVCDPESARRTVEELTDGRGGDLVVDAVGAPRGLDLAFSLVRRGGTVSSVGVPSETTWSLPVQRAFVDELGVRFVIGDLMRDFDELIGLVRSGAVDPTVVASEVVGLDEAFEAYQRMSQRRTLKSLLAT